MQTPSIEERGPAGLVLWLRQDQPAVWAQLVARIPEAATIENVIRQQENLQGLGFFAAIGRAIMGYAKTAMPKLVAALPEIASAAVQVGGQVLVAQQQKKLIDAQIKQAEAGQAPLSTQVVPNQFVAVPSVTGSGLVSQPRVVRTTLIPGVPDVAVYLGGAMLFALVLKRFR